MTLRIPRFALLTTALLIGVISLHGLATAQVDELPTRPSTSRSSETLVLSDDFEDPESGVIPPFETDSQDISVEYDGGVFDIDALEEDFQGALAVPFGDVYTDVTVAVDAGLSSVIADQPGRYIFLTCRTEDAVGGYRMEFRPLSSSVIIRKLSGGAGEQIANGAFNDGEPFEGTARLEFSCQDSTISGSVNGLQVVTVEDPDFTEGRLDLGGGVYTISSGRISVDFDNLAVSVPNDLAPTETPPPTVAASPTTAPTSTPSPTPTPSPSPSPTAGADDRANSDNRPLSDHGAGRRAAHRGRRK